MRMEGNVLSPSEFHLQPEILNVFWLSFKASLKLKKVQFLFLFYLKILFANKMVTFKYNTMNVLCLKKNTGKYLSWPYRLLKLNIQFKKMDRLVAMNTRELRKIACVFEIAAK